MTPWGPVKRLSNHLKDERNQILIPSPSPIRLSTNLFLDIPLVILFLDSITRSTYIKNQLHFPPTLSLVFSLHYIYLPPNPSPSITSKPPHCIYSISFSLRAFLTPIFHMLHPSSLALFPSPGYVTHISHKIQRESITNITFLPRSCYAVGAVAVTNSH